MMEIPVGSQIFDLVYHPTFSTVYTALLTGHVKAFAYDDECNSKNVFTLRPSKRSCRGLSINHDGSQLLAVGKAKAISIIDTDTQKTEIRTKAHDSPINRVKYLMPSLFSTGDDDGVIKLWDPRQRDPLRTYTQHFDYITDFLWLDDKRHLVATRQVYADGTLSVMDVKSKKQEPIVQSEDQEDELLSIVAIKGGTKVAVGTQLGILSIFNRNKGWADCVDRVPGHPLSIDALCNLPPNVPNVDASNTILTGSSDGFVRAVQLFPTKLLGVVTDHGEWPVERIAIGGGRGQLSLDRNSDGSIVKNRSSGIDGDDSPEEDEEENQGQRLWWVGSIGHEDTLRMSNLEAFFSKAKKTGASSSFNDEGALSNEVENEETEAEVGQDEEGDRCDTVDRAGNSGDDSDEPKPKKRKRKPGKDPLKVKRGKGKSGVVVDDTFFNDL